MSLDQTVLDQVVPRIDEALSRHPAVGLALAIVRDGSLEHFRSHGVADVDTRRPVTPDTGFRVASITKTFTAIAVMQLWEQGRVDLDAPANDHLRAFRLERARTEHREPTLRHLLTHTSGIGEEAGARLWRRDFGESVPPGQVVPTLVEFYGGHLRLDAEPGTRFRYTDHGIAAAGQVVEDVSGMPLDRYLREHVFLPLGMDDTELLLTEAARTRLATGYTLRRRGPHRVPLRRWVQAAASMATSTPRDMTRYAAALLGGGANEHGRVLLPETLESMFAAHYQPDPRIPGLGLGFFRGRLGEHHVVDHQGILPGFDSELLVAPDEQIAVMAFSNGTRQGMMWLPTELSELLGLLLGVGPPAVVPQRPEVWGELCGRYRLPGSVTDLRVRSLVGAGVEVGVRRGRLVLRALSPVPALLRGMPLDADDPDDPYAFRIDLSRFGFGALRVVFAPDPATGAMAVHLDLMPLSAYRTVGRGHRAVARSRV